MNIVTIREVQVFYPSVVNQRAATQMIAPRGICPRGVMVEANYPPLCRGKFNDHAQLLKAACKETVQLIGSSPLFVRGESSYWVPRGEGGCIG